MAIETKQTNGGKVLEVLVTGKLVKGDYEQFVPEAETLLKIHDKIRMLVVLHNFRGWTAGAAWEDIKFDTKHFNDIERLVVVGEQRWQRNATEFYKPFTTAKIRYCDAADLAQARTWVEEGL